jgi:hypothetical protein
MGPRWKRQSANTATATSTLKQVHNNNGNSENISTRKSSEKTCKSRCVDGRCCFDTQNCEVPSDITCSDYEGCLVVYAVDNDDDGTSATGVETQAPESPSSRGNSNELGSLSTVIMAACEEGGDMQEECDEVCSAGQCCFPSRNCQVPSVITCEDYSGCSVLYSMDGGR